MFEKIHEQVERAHEQREEHQMDHQRAGGDHTGAVSSEAIAHIQETQFKILTNLEHLSMQVDILAKNGGGGGGGHAPSPGSASSPHVDAKLDTLTYVFK